MDHQEQTNVESALSLLESNNLVSTNVVQSLRSLYQNIGSGEEMPASSRPLSPKSLGSLSPKHEVHVEMTKNPCTSDELKSERILEHADNVSMPEEAVGSATRRQFKPASSKRQQLTAEEAAEIYEMRPKIKDGKALKRGSMLKCKAIAPKFGVTPKTIRDIWRGRTWTQATEHLWTESERA